MIDFVKSFLYHLIIFIVIISVLSTTFMYFLRSIMYVGIVSYKQMDPTAVAHGKGRGV